jgi:cell division protein FtsQ
MSFKQHIKKIGIISLWIAMASGLLILLIAAAEKKDHAICTGVDVTITGAGDVDFLDKKDVLALLNAGSKNKPEGKPLRSFHLQQLEETLKKNVWVKNADLFFDNNRVLNIHIAEREPIARVFTVMGSSFYIDSSGKALPLTDRITMRLPVFTAFPAEKTTGLSKGARQTLNDMKKLSLFLLRDSFWMAQVRQLAITSDGGFEILPASAKYIIGFGSAEDYESKFSRLFLFNKEILSKTGTDKYNRIDVRFNKQVVATRNGSSTKMDSLQTMINIRKMIADATKLPEDSLFTSVEKNNTVISKADTTLPVLKGSIDKQHKQQSNSLSKNPVTIRKPPYPLQIRPSNAYAKPKAIMPERE